MTSEITDQELLERWSNGDESAAEQMFERYSRRTWKLAENLIAQRFKSRFDGDDVVQSVFRTFLRHSREGDFRVGPAESLWKLLSAIVRNKICQRVDFHTAQRRSANREQPLESGRNESQPDELLAAMDPRPEEALALVEEIATVLDAFELCDREVFRLCLEGHSSSEIAHLLGCSRWSVRRALDSMGHVLRLRLMSGVVEP